MKYDLTERDINVLLTAWAHCSGDGFPKIDYPKLAEHCGLKNAASATTAFCAAKKKILAQDPSADAGAGASKTPTKTPGKKRKTAAEDGEETRKPKKQRAKKVEVEVEEDEEKAEDAAEEEKVKDEVKEDNETGPKDEDESDEA